MDRRHLCADVLIVGGGVAGLSCALFTSQAGLLTMVFDSGDSQVRQVPALRNYPGISDAVSGEELLKVMRDQAFRAGAVILPETAERIGTEEGKAETEQLLSVMTPAGTYCGHHLVIASNRHTALLEALGFEIEVNVHVPSGKIYGVRGVDWTGRTPHPRIHIAGLLANIPSQTVIAAGQGAAVGVQIASDRRGSPYMWHD